MSNDRHNRDIPIVMAPGALSEAAHAHDDSASAPIPGPAPAYLHVAGHPIDEAEIAREMQFHRAATPHLAREDAARTLVIRTLVRLECERLGIAPEPEADETADEARVRQLLDREVQSPIADEPAVRRYFESNHERLHHPDRVLVDHILLAAAPDDPEGRLRAREAGETLIAQLREAPERFAEFAMRHSACPSREQGGSLDWVCRGDTVPEFERQLFMLREGLAGLTVETRYGHHVVFMRQIEHGAPLSYEDAAPVVAAYLETQAHQNAIHDYLQQLHERYPVEGWEHVSAGR